MVAVIGGIQFQSACQRLAERSAVMRVKLVGKSPSQSSTNSWWQTVSQRVLNFPKTAQYFFRALIGLTPAVPDFPISGGRWQQINEPDPDF